MQYSKPKTGRRRPLNPRGRAPALSEVDFMDLIDGFNHRHQDRDRAIFLMSYKLGLRAKELAGLKLGDVLHPSGDLKTDVMLRAETTKGLKTRETFLENVELRDALKAYLKRREKMGRFAPDQALFLSQKGGHFSANSMQKLFAKLYLHGGFKASSHSGRRSFATRLNEKGVDLRSIQVLMGHAYVSTTQAYIETSPDRLRRFVKML